MTSLVEQGLVEFMSEFFAANEVTCPVHPGTSNAAIPATEPVAIINVRECVHEVGPLYTGKLELIISTPAMAQKTVEDHRLIVAAAEDAFDPENGAEISAAVEEKADCTVNGWFYEGPRDSQQDDRWLTTMNFTLGLVRAD
jgi:hypothetical protein